MLRPRTGVVDNGGVSDTGAPPRQSRRGLLTAALLLCAALVVGLLFLQGWSRGGQDDAVAATFASTGSLPTPTAAPTPAPPAPTSEAPEAAPTPVSGLPTIRESELPPEALDTLDLIWDDGPYPFRQDDSTFFNREGILPRQSQGYYREYTVITPGSRDRGARRIVVGADWDMYYTADHYASFTQILEGE